MDRSIRRVLYTALVAGGLVVVGASTAHAAVEGLLDPVTQETTGTIAEAAAARGHLGAADGASPAGERAETAGADLTGANGEPGLVDDVVGPKGVVQSLLRADVAGVLDETLGDDGVVDDLLTEVTPGGADAPLPDGPDTEQPDTEQPGTEQPDTAPGTDGPGISDPPGTDEPGTDGPGTDGPGADGPGADEPGTNGPGADRPGAGRPGSGGPDAGRGTDRPGTSDRDTGPRTERPGTGKARTDGADEPESPTGNPADELPSAGLPVPDVNCAGSGGSSTDTAGTDGSRPGVKEDHGTAAAAPGPGEYLSSEGVDLAWGDTAGVVPTSSSGTMLALDRDHRRRSISTEPEAEAEAEAVRKVVPDATLAETGHMITGQLSLISLLLGLGIAALRMRRR